MLIIFDLDDTLIDSYGCNIVPALRKVNTWLVENGYVATEDEELLRLNATSLSARHALQKYLINHNYSLFEQAFKIYKKNTHGSITIMDGAKEVLQRLSSHTLVVVTKGREEKQFRKLRESGLRNFFHRIVVTPYYDKGEYYSRLLQDFSLNPTEVVVIGDKVATDLLPAKALGIHTIHMQWGRGKIQTAREGEVSYSISHLSEIPEIIGKL